MEEILIVTRKYPTEKSMTNVFLACLAEEFARQGKTITVISPDSLTERYIRKNEPQPLYREKNINGNIIRIYSPRYISFSTKKILGINFGRLTVKSFERAVIRQYKKLKINPDAVYGHFIDPAGLAAAAVGRRFGIPSFFAYGESSPDIHKGLGDKWVADKLKNITGVISVSSENKDILVNLGLCPEEKIKVFPNSIDNSLFYPRDKEQMRLKFGMDKDKFIVGFVGHFINRKGPLRVEKALASANADIGAVYIGKGECEPKADNIIFKGTLPHSAVPEYLSACDVFVLPTLAEGCCNAIVEAMACGLPVISSNLPFNKDILNEHNSVMIDPMNIDEIKDAVLKLYTDKEVCAKMSEEAIKTAGELTIEKRAMNILAFMEKRKEKDNV